MNVYGLREFLRRRIPFLLILAALGWAVWHFRDRNSPPISASGGNAFHNFKPIETPFFQQNDDRWKDAKMGGSGDKLGEAGCAVCSLAMAVDHFGFSITPGQLNEQLKDRDGYTLRGWLKWQTVTSITSNKLVAEIIAKPSHEVIDGALSNKCPVLAKLLISGNIPHWILIVGKEGTNYLMRDPLGDGHSLDPVSKYESDIFGVRIIKPAL